MSFNFSTKDGNGNTLTIGWDYEDPGGERYLSIEIDSDTITEECKHFWCEFKISPSDWMEISKALSISDTPPVDEVPMKPTVVTL